MKTYTAAEVDEKLDFCCGLPAGTVEHDERGQLIIYTGIYQWDDQTFHDEPQKK